jgi:DNA-binding transcriptional LysR family regulator
MNVHHLELFYYVAKHRGISAAVRHIPYGIQQPAVSGQIGALEESLGVRLFERSPFRLTAAGEKLYAHARPFFERLDEVAAGLHTGERQELRIGATELVLRQHIPPVVQRLRERHPQLRLSIRPGHQTQLETWLRDGLIDLAVGPVDARPQARLRHLRLVAAPIVLLVPRRSPVRSAAELWKHRKIKEPLVGVPAQTSLMRSFQRGLKKRGVTWAQTIEASSMELVTCYVANGEGYGVNLDIAEAITHPEVRVLPLDGFDPMVIGLIWKGEPSELMRVAFGELQRYSQETWPERFVRDELPGPKARRGRARKA